MRLDDLPTPALLLDLERLEANIARMAARAREFGVRLRPHVKTHKCVDIAERQRAAGARGITVSTLYEARVFGDHGFDDITWAYPFVLNRVEEARELAERSRLGMRARLNLVVDAEAAVTALEESGHPFAVWLKVDSGYHRAGVDPESALAVELARRLSASAVLTFAGLLSHSGHAYQGRTRAEIARIAERDRKTMVTLAEALREQGVPVAAVSVGSTPAVLAARHLQGVDEIRPGNYAFFDYTQCELKSCTPADCAVTVLASVASSQPGSKHSVVDAGALALSKDAGPNGRSHPSMGRIFSDYSAGTLEPTRRLVSLSQEHGIVNGRLDVGARIRILPNHSCLAVAQFDEYHVVSGDRVVERWKIWRGR
jgi:D-serine deaminase-like pyridoxal phosphate-dependent protein